MKLSKEKEGAASAVLFYLLWGFVPIYWNLTEHVSLGEILAQQVFGLLFLCFCF